MSETKPSTSAITSTGSLVAITRAALDAFDREVAESRKRAERLLADIELWEQGGAVPSYAARYVAASEGDDPTENRWLETEMQTSFDLHDLPLQLLADLGTTGRINREHYFELLKDYLGDSLGTGAAADRAARAIAAPVNNA